MTNPSPYDEDEHLAAELSNTIDGLVSPDTGEEEELAPVQDVKPKKKIGFFQMILMVVGIGVIGGGGWVGYTQYTQMKKPKAKPVQPFVEAATPRSEPKDLLAPIAPETAGSKPIETAQTQLPGELPLPGATSPAPAETPPTAAVTPIGDFTESVAVVPEKSESISPDVKVGEPAKVEVKEVKQVKEVVIKKEKEIVKEELVDVASDSVDVKVVKKTVKKKKPAVKKRKPVSKHEQEAKPLMTDEIVVKSRTETKLGPDVLTAPVSKKPDSQYWQPMF